MVNCTETFSGPVTLTATDNCSDPSVFGYAWMFDIGNDGTSDGQGAGAEINAGDLGLG